MTALIVTLILLAIPLVAPLWFPAATSFVEANKLWISLCALVSGVLCTTYIGSWVSGRLGKLYAERKRVWSIQARLSTLTLEEKHVLQQYIEEDSRTAFLRLRDGVATALVLDGILYTSSPYRTGARGAYNISSEAWSYLHRHPNLIATPDNPRPPITGNEWMAD